MLFLVFLPILSNGLLLVLDVFSFIFFYPVGSFYKTFLLDVDTLRLFSIFGFQGTDSFLWMFPSSGDGEIRTLDPLLARQVLSQLSYAPIPDGSLVWLFRKSLFQVLFQVFSPPVGLSGLEPPTSRLSGVRSNRLSYKPFCKIWHPPALPCRLQHSTIGRLGLNRRVRDGNGCFP